MSTPTLTCDMCKRSDREVRRVSNATAVHYACVDQEACADDWWRLMLEHDAEKKARRAARARELRAARLRSDSSQRPAGPEPHPSGSQRSATETPPAEAP